MFKRHHNFQPIDLNIDAFLMQTAIWTMTKFEIQIFEYFFPITTKSFTVDILWRLRIKINLR